MDAQLIFVSFIAGMLTILAPCIFPLLPILIGSSSEDTDNSRNAFTVIISLLSTILFLTLMIHGTANALNIDEGILRLFSGLLLTFVGVVTLFPELWERVSLKLKLSSSSNSLLAKAMKKDGRSKYVLIGIALGPIFSSCSPTYGVIIATILPENFVTGTIYLLWYILGLGLMFTAIAIFGKKATNKLSWATNPRGWLKKTVSVLFIIIGLAVLFNLDKSFESRLLELNVYNKLTNFELNLR